MNEQLSFLQNDNPRKEDYYCPNCTHKMARELTMPISPDSEIYDGKTMGHKSTALLALYILQDLQAPPKALEILSDWFSKIQKDELTLEVEEKLKLLRWKRSSQTM